MKSSSKTIQEGLHFGGAPYGANAPELTGTFDVRACLPFIHTRAHMDLRQAVVKVEVISVGTVYKMHLREQLLISHVLLQIQNSMKSSVHSSVWRDVHVTRCT